MRAAERLVRRVLGEPELIGPPECPLIYRWGLFGEDAREPCGRCGGTGHYELGGVADVRCDCEDGERVTRRPVKLLLHYFLPDSADRDPHDHPRPFWTFVLAGSYEDTARRPSAMLYNGEPVRDDDGRPRRVGWLVSTERMRAGTLRYRRAGHTHTAVAGPRGCWTLVLMGPVRRPWGFWRDGRWWAYKAYTKRFGHGMRCP